MLHQLEWLITIFLLSMGLCNENENSLIPISLFVWESRYATFYSSLLPCLCPYLVLQKLNYLLE